MNYHFILNKKIQDTSPLIGNYTTNRRMMQDFVGFWRIKVKVIVLLKKQQIRTLHQLVKSSDLYCLVRRKGLEPPTLGTGIRCSIH